jgi:hypothetical protein
MILSLFLNLKKIYNYFVYSVVRFLLYTFVKPLKVWLVTGCPALSADKGGVTHVRHMTVRLNLQKYPKLNSINLLKVNKKGWNNWLGMVKRYILVHLNILKCLSKMKNKSNFSEKSLWTGIMWAFWLWTTGLSKKIFWTVCGGRCFLSFF